MRPFRIAFAAGLALLGCTGTEVGNPEMVSARVSMLSASGWEMRSFPIQVTGLTYREMDGDSGSLWDIPGGNLLDAADSTANSLSGRRAAFSDWASATLEIAFNPSSYIPGDSTAWGQMRDPGWAVFRYTYATVDEKLVFAMPETIRVRLTYDSLDLKAATHGDTLSLTAFFDCGAWVVAMGGNFNLTRHAGVDGDFAVLSPTENADVYIPLKDTLSGSFKTEP